MQAIKPIAYEILRRNDGMVAISVNAGLIAFEPASIRIRKTSVFVQEKRPRQGGEPRAAELVGVALDVLERIEREQRLRFFEFASFGMTAAHSLELLA